MTTQTTFTQVELDDMATWVHGINPLTTSEEFDMWINGFDAKFKKEGRPILKEMADQYREARKAYGK